MTKFNRSVTKLIENDLLNLFGPETKSLHENVRSKRRLMSVSKLLSEADEMSNQVAPPVNDSIDAQVDKFLVAAESASTSNEAVNEAEGDEEEKDPVKDEEDFKGAVDKKKTLDDIDIDAFASEVARLAENAESLLEFKDVVINRAMNFLKKAYDNNVIEAVRETLKERFSLAVGESKKDINDERSIAPAADRAGPEIGA